MPSGAYLTTAMNSVSCHIWGAGAPAKTKKGCSPSRRIFFSGKGPTFPISCKISEQERRARPWDWEV